METFRRLAFVVSALVLCLPLGCGEQTRTVSIGCLFTFFLDDGLTTSREGCGGTTPTEFITYQRLSSGEWNQVGSASLTSASPSVLAPAGDYLLGVKYAAFSYWEFFETSSDSFSLGGNAVGRSNLQEATSETLVTFNVDGIYPWDQQDYIQLTSSDGSTLKTLASPSGGTSLPPDVTSAQLSFDWNGSGSSLPDGNQGDVVYLHQLASFPVATSGLSYQSAAQFASLGPTFSVADGTTQSVSVTLGPVSQTGRLTTAWRLSAFEQYSADINPAAIVQHWLLIQANPHSLSDKPLMAPGNPSLFAYQLPAGTADQDLMDLPYGQFLPDFWVEYRNTYLAAVLTLFAPGASTPANVYAYIARFDPLPGAPEPDAPVVTPPLQPQIGTADAFQSPSGVGVTPTFRWALPRVGTPTSYNLRILQPVVSGNLGTEFQTIAYLTTSKMSISIPPNLLQADIPYVAILTADVKAPDTSATAPYHLSYPYAYASAVFTFTP